MTPVRVAHIATVDSTLRFLLMGQLERLREEGFEVTGISAPGPWTDDLERAGIRFVEWPHVTRAWDPRADSRAFVSLLKLLRRERFDIVHTHTPKPGVLGRIAGRMARTPVVVNTVHGFYATPSDRFLRRFAVLGMEAVAARFSHLELFQSEEDLAWSRRRRVARRRAALLGNGTDLTRFTPDAIPRERVAALRDELRIPREAPVVGVVARLVAEKGYRELFAAARIVRAAMPEVRFLAVGADEGEAMSRLTPDEVAAARADVVFAGWRLDIPDLIACCDVFTLPSWREGLPRSAIEAAAMGKPLVLTDIRGCREVVRDGVEGLLVPPRDANALAGALLRLVRDPAERERMGRAAIARARERFDERAVADRVVEHYRRLLTASRRSPAYTSADGHA
jgi:glycosyltransferase involved in cell wall biosynthesis